MKFINIAEFIILVFLGACTNAQNQKENDRLIQAIKTINSDYVKTKAFFKSDYVTHFPENLDSSYITFTENLSPETGEIRLDLTCRLPDKRLLMPTLSKSIATYNSTDSCLLIVNRFATKDNFYHTEISEKDKKYIDQKCYESLYPIPNFWDNRFSVNKTACKLPKNFVIYVFDCKSGKFMEDSLLTDGSFMPLKWKNGMSKGVAINEKEQLVIYWVIIW